MNSSAFHLNLLKDSERLSSSPVRLRVMLPAGALLSCAGLLIWWGMLFTQLIMVKSQSQSIEDDLAAKNKAHAEIIQKRDLARDIKLQLEQLEYYSNAVRHVGEPLAHFAEIVPLRIQLREFSFSELPEQNLLPKGAKVPLFGPTDNVETQSLIIAGLTTKDTPVVAMMESLEAPEFTNLMTRARQINSYKQDNAEFDGRKLLSFEIEYTMPERRFAK